MSSYPRSEALLAECRAGLGKIVIVEGESVDQDPYFYGRWFGDLARQVSFVPQNGCEQVVKAVVDLRAEFGPAREVYGIRDRDFCDEEVLTVQDLSMPADGVFRTRWHTLENYLLEPEGWYEVVKLVSRSTLPPGWDSVEAVRERIFDAYRSCLPVAAFNLTVKHEYARRPEDPTGAAFGYKAHPNAVDLVACQQLGGWGAARGAPQGLDQVYEEELARLRSEPFEQWQRLVTGKAVLKVFKNGFPGGVPPRLLDNLYLEKHPQPPEDLQRLIHRVLAGP